MNLHDYLQKTGSSQSELARKIDAPAVLVHQWATGKRRVPAERCPTIERATAGVVTCEELRPDVDWGYLRGATPPGEHAPRSRPSPQPACGQGAKSECLTVGLESTGAAVGLGGAGQGAAMKTDAGDVREVA